MRNGNQCNLHEFTNTAEKCTEARKILTDHYSQYIQHVQYQGESNDDYINRLQSDPLISSSTETLFDKAMYIMENYDNSYKFFSD